MKTRPLPANSAGATILTPIRLIGLTALFVAATGNVTFFSQAAQIYPLSDGHLPFLLSVGVLLTGVLMLLMTLLSCLLPVRWVTGGVVILAAAIGYFTDHYGTVMDVSMIRNVIETDSGEAGDIINTGLLTRLLLLGLLPAAALWRMPIHRAARWTELRHKALAMAGTVILMLVCLLGFSDAYAGFFRQHKPLRYYTNPTFALYSMAQFVSRPAAGHDPENIRHVADGAMIPDSDEGRELVILVVGETARRDRFSLNAYTRETNPELNREHRLISYTNISACGTSTAVSVPCMFAQAGRDEFDDDQARQVENVLDVLSRTGVSVLWRDNNSGSKGVAARIEEQDFSTPAVNPDCDTECRDIGMLSGLQAYIDAQTTDTLIVLHQMGNHGPAYFKRYPPGFERFTPACHEEELSRCTDEEIGNAYDNAILYTDYFLSQVIALLKANTPQFETAMLYVSDHGESLGENNLYLHGIPYWFAPAEQTEVPVLVWVGESSDIALESALDLRAAVNSHDAVFQALLSVFEVETGETETGPPLFLVNDVGQ